ncbi:MAG: 50S ribosomal protein L9 [Chloroflexi bacterium]|nr:50S ribosomal protein L9 [Chloroflexota bacterium]
MKVVLLEEVAGLGKAGDAVEAAPGYARNFLLPRKLATPATPAALKEAEAIREAEARRQAKTEAELAELAQKLRSLSVSIKAKAGAEGKLFGSVTTAQIARELKQMGYDLDRRRIELAEPIRAVGAYPVTVRITRDLTPQITVNVTGE